MVNVLGNLNVDLDVFYKKQDLPTLSLGDTVKVTIYLELPKEVSGEKKKKKESKYTKVLLSQSTK